MIDTPTAVKKYLSRKNFLEFAEDKLKSQIPIYNAYSRFIFAILASAIAEAKMPKYRKSKPSNRLVLNELVVDARAFLHPKDRKFKKYCGLLSLDENWAAEIIWEELHFYDQWEMQRSSPQKKETLERMHNEINDWFIKARLPAFRTNNTNGVTL